MQFRDKSERDVFLPTIGHPIWWSGQESNLQSSCSSDVIPTQAFSKLSARREGIEPSQNCFGGSLVAMTLRRKSGDKNNSDICSVWFDVIAVAFTKNGGTGRCRLSDLLSRSMTDTSALS